MQSTVTVIKEAGDISLITPVEARLCLNLTTSSDDNTDKLITTIVRWSSAQVAALCNRTFARETVTEVFRGLDGYNDARLHLNRFPVSSIESVDENGTVLIEDVDYELEAGSGKLTRLDSAWADPVTVTYIGGYNLPHEAPAALSQATILLAREAYYAAIRGDASIRMVGHKESRVIYFDPARMGGSGAGGGQATVGSAAQRAVTDLLRRYMRVPA